MALIPGIIFPWEAIPLASLEITQGRVSELKLCQQRQVQLENYDPLEQLSALIRADLRARFAGIIAGQKAPFAWMEKALEYPRQMHHFYGFVGDLFLFYFIF